MAVYADLAARYMQEHPDVAVEIVPVAESAVASKLTAAIAGDGELPDLVRLGVERLPLLMRVDLLDTDAITAVVASVGREDFRARPLQYVTVPDSGELAAIPFDGWLQALWYRRDLFQERGLNAPVSWADIDAACDAFADDPEMLGITLPTTPDQNYVHQVFEQVAMSNNAWPFDDAGNVTMNTPEMVEALRFYTGLQRCAPQGAQDLFTARGNYELGQAAMLFYSTYIMDDLVEGSNQPGNVKIELPLQDLPERTGFAASMVGPKGVAAYGQLVTLAILAGADPATADVATFFMTEGYLPIIATAPLGKVPTLESATEEWITISPIFERYSPATLGHIANGFDTMNRWLLRPTYTQSERAALGVLESRLSVPQAIYRIAVEGSLTPESAAAFLQEELETIVRTGAE